MQSLTTVMGNSVDLAQLGVEKFSFEKVMLTMWCVENKNFDADSCTKGTKEFLENFLENPSENDYKTTYVVKLANTTDGMEYENWRAKYVMPLWAPVVLVLGLIVLVGVGVFVGALLCPKSGVGNVKF